MLPKQEPLFRQCAVPTGVSRSWRSASRLVWNTQAACEFQDQPLECTTGASACFNAEPEKAPVGERQLCCRVGAGHRFLHRKRKLAHAQHHTASRIAITLPLICTAGLMYGQEHHMHIHCQPYHLAAGRRQAQLRPHAVHLHHTEHTLCASSTPSMHEHAHRPTAAARHIARMQPMHERADELDSTGMLSTSYTPLE
jgi:hypothetical protein